MSKVPLEIWANDYFRTNSTYKKQVSALIDYLKLPTVNRINQVASISKTDVEEFVGSSPQIKNIDTLSSYLEGIKSFDDFLVNNNYRSQYMIPRGNQYGEWKSSLASTFGFKERVEREYLPDCEIKSILNTLDSYLSESNYQHLGLRARDYFVYLLCLRIYIKLCLIAPAKKAVLFDLRFENFTSDFKVVQINSVEIKITNGLRANILQTLDIVQEVTKTLRKDSDNFLEYFATAVNSKKKNLRTALNGKFYIFLKDNNLMSGLEKTKKSFPLEVLSNSTIRNMIIRGTNPLYISQISGIGISQLENKFYSKLSDLTLNSTASNEINFSIACCDYYQYI